MRVPGRKLWFRATTYTFFYVVREVISRVLYSYLLKIVVVTNFVSATRINMCEA
jgi:hypothetical protein